jgi:hypothetical protein
MAGLGVAVGVGVSVGGSDVNVLVGAEVTVDVGGTDVTVGVEGATNPHPVNKKSITAPFTVRLKILIRVGFIVMSLSLKIYGWKAFLIRPGKSKFPISFWKICATLDE